MHEALIRLAEAHGFVPHYHDIWGTLHHVEHDALISLLAAIGVTVETDADVAAQLRVVELQRWQSVLPPVQVVRVNERPWRVRVNLPQALGDGNDESLRWQLLSEHGETRCEAPLNASGLHEYERADTPRGPCVARELTLDLELEPGYHQLSLQHAGTTLARMSLVVAPAACFVSPAVRDDGRTWGAAVQLYGVRSERNWGIGDFTDLAALLGEWGRRGAGIVGLNPLHALFPHEPLHASPYSPSSRLYKNVLYIDVEAVADYAECEPARALVRDAAFQAHLRALREAELVDYAGVSAAKLRVLEVLYASFRACHLDTQADARAQAFRAFQRSGGESLHRHALFEALQEHFHRADAAVWGWPAWPEAYRDPHAAAVAQFAAESNVRVEYYEYLQWQADLQLATAGRRAHALHLAVGIYEDLAVSVDRGGAETWANQSLYALSASVGAPPDDFSLQGQNWGLPPLIPDRLRQAAYRPFIDTLRATMRHAGAVRIDHVMGLARLFWVPPGVDATHGTYVRYPFADLLGILALESHRNQCMVIGEDLGTVPDEVRAALARHQVLSYRLLYFERRDGGDFKSPAEYPRDALVAITTHDLPTLAGWWGGRDIVLRTELGLFPNEAMREQHLVGRAQDRTRLLLAFAREGLLPQDVSVDPLSLPHVTPAFARAAAVYLGRTPSRVFVMQLEDVLGVGEQANMPGTIDTHPNWRRKLPVTLEQLHADARFVAFIEAMTQLRGGAPQAAHASAQIRAVVPRATYRLQLHRDFGFDQAAAIVPYLAELGVSHVYCSPCLRARAGSAHGYDIVDHGALNDELGGGAAFERFVETLHAHDMGMLLDMVPNHMGVMGSDNAWWLDVLENGPASAFADYFDIDWQSLDPALHGKVLVPVLGDHYGNVLERGELVLDFDAAHGALALHYHEHCFPLDPRDYPRVLQSAGALLAPGALDDTALAEWQALVAAFGYLPARDDAAAPARVARQRDKEVHKHRLAALVAAHPALDEAIAAALHRFNGAPGGRSNFDALDALLEAQAYRLAFWRVASDEINYRRFFDVNDLAALRMENPLAFEATHRFVLELAAAGKIDGLRIDHADGLYDPAAYLARLQVRYAQLAGAAAPLAPEARPLYVVIEKITAPHEDVPQAWPVYGTTGYRYLSVLDGVFVDTAARSALTRAWSTFVGAEAQDFERCAYEGKRLIMRTALAAELTVLSGQLLRIARADRRTRDFTLNTLRQALTEVVACFPVYRTYLVEGPSAQDRRYVEWAVSRARRQLPAAEDSIFEFIRDVLLVQAPAEAPTALIEAYRAFARKFQQYTAPVAAKGVEDTAFYRYNRLVSLNEVGGDPQRFGLTVKAFHGASAARATRWPHTMLATSTHDSKRSEDVRARIHVLSELASNWRLALRRWSRINRARRVRVDDQPAPSRNDEYLLYQTLLGTLPIELADDEALARYRARIERYMIKALREAKVRTSWMNVNHAYEAGVLEFVGALLGRLADNPFLDELRALAQPVAWFGALNSSAMALIKLVSPGVPDVYQGNEMLDFSLVDPDNRHAVDYALRSAALRELDALARASQPALAAGVQALFEQPHDGRAKLWVVRRALQVRRAHETLLRDGGYAELRVHGARAPQVLAFARRNAEQMLVAVTARLHASLGVPAGVLPLGAAVWGDTAVTVDAAVDDTGFVNVLTGETIALQDGQLPLSQLFAHCPLALLVREVDAAPVRA